MAWSVVGQRGLGWWTRKTEVDKEEEKEEEEEEAEEEEKEGKRKREGQRKQFERKRNIWQRIQIGRQRKRPQHRRPKSSSNPAYTLCKRHKLHLLLEHPNCSMHHVKRVRVKVGGGCVGEWSSV